MSSESLSGGASVRAVDRALDVLLCIAHSDGGLGLSDISRQVGLHKSTVHRLLLSLERKGFVRRSPESDRYLIGWTVLELLGNVYHSNELSTALLPEMTQLRDVTGETVSLYIRSGRERIRIQSVESHESIRNVAGIGKTYPLYIGASGKVLLAFADDDVVEDVLSDPLIPPTIHRSDLLQQLARIRTEGHAISIQERDAGAAALAAPIFIREPDLIAALSVSGPVSRFTYEKMSEFIDTVKEAANRMSKLLAHY